MTQRYFVSLDHTEARVWHLYLPLSPAVEECVLLLCLVSSDSHSIRALFALHAYTIGKGDMEQRIHQ